MTVYLWSWWGPCRSREGTGRPVAALYKRDSVMGWALAQQGRQLPGSHVVGLVVRAGPCAARHAAWLSCSGVVMELRPCSAGRVGPWQGHPVMFWDLAQQVIQAGHVLGPCSAGHTSRLQSESRTRLCLRGLWQLLPSRWLGTRCHQRVAQQSWLPSNRP
jgi:hypothetical protein